MLYVRAEGRGQRLMPSSAGQDIMFAAVSLAAVSKGM